MVHGPGAALHEVWVKLLLNRETHARDSRYDDPDRVDRRIEMLQSQDDAPTIR